MDRVILATGHARNAPDPEEREFLHFASEYGTRYVLGDSAADLSLADVPAGRVVGIKGMGLGFYDLIAAFTVGRGGTYRRGENGRLIYLPSGQEPKIVAGSRRGIPVLARGRNQKRVGRFWKARFLTREAVERRRAGRIGSDADTRLDFRADIWPLLLDEVQCVHYTTAVRLASGEEASEEFAALYQKLRGKGESTDELVKKFGLGDASPFDLEHAANPFRDRDFDSVDAYQQAVLEVLRHDVAEARKGNIGSPYKAALDTVRDLRPLIRELVAFGGLTPRSHREDFLGRFCPLHSLLSAGPPLTKVEQSIALIESGALRIVGPRTTFGTDKTTGCFTVSSPQVSASEVRLSTLIDSRIPSPDVRRDTSELTRQLLSDGIMRTYVNEAADGADSFATGGVDIDEETFRLIGAGGRPDPHLYAIGIPTEGPVWFTAVGSGRTTGKHGVMPDYATEADVVAQDVLRK